MATSIYINNNPGNIKYFSEGGTEGVDYYLSATGTGIKYKKFNSKAEGLKGILDLVYTHVNTDVDSIMKEYAKDDKSGKAIKNYGAELRHAYNVAKNLDYDNNDELKKFIQGVTHFENSANSEDYRAYYTDKDYDDAVKLFQEERLLDRGTIDEQIKDAEMQGLNLQ
tara:strand:- start:344 stop:844 length:501 start_codon:yes stop_codon:yes gene_type:complete